MVKKNALSRRNRVRTRAAIAVLGVAVSTLAVAAPANAAPHKQTCVGIPNGTLCLGVLPGAGDYDVAGVTYHKDRGPDATVSLYWLSGPEATNVYTGKVWVGGSVSGQGKVVRNVCGKGSLYHHESGNSWETPVICPPW
ncbi:hypothetical protein [Amycolatopsis sp. CA-230715]|uniref:hypothetical protein n=1 Tax=Amycolatopsis sp. CA-230715 TaxID=2745196 RepID=UPI001C02A78C|nr:hypothetical protein [Amycolatopsis sp. CA-230715]QWF83799.1 hypothetical protein HUW46_07242 [Amycolatopsis sp. CA-230715]